MASPLERRGEPVRGAHQVLLGEAVDVSEAGHLAVDHPDARAALAAGLRPLDPRLVDREGEAVALLAEELGEVAAARERALQDPRGEVSIDQGHGFAISPGCTSRALASALARSRAAAAAPRPRSGARRRGRAPGPPPSPPRRPRSGRRGSRSGRMACAGGGGGAGRPPPRRRSRRRARAAGGAAWSSCAASRRPARRSAFRMSKIISEESVKRSATATAVSPLSRTQKASPSPVATCACATGSPPAASAAAISSRPASPQRSLLAARGEHLAASERGSRSRASRGEISCR